LPQGLSKAPPPARRWRSGLCARRSRPLDALLRGCSTAAVRSDGSGARRRRCLWHGPLPLGWRRLPFPYAAFAIAAVGFALLSPSPSVPAKTL